MGKVTKLKNGKTYKVTQKHQGREYDLYCRPARKEKPDKTRQQKAKLPPPPPDSDEESIISEPPDFRREYSRLRASTLGVFPTCSDFGTSRRVKFPGYFFCSKCDFWDTNVALGNKKAKRNSARNKCQAEHTSLIMPTDKLVFEDELSNNDVSHTSKENSTMGTKEHETTGSNNTTSTCIIIEDDTSNVSTHQHTGTLEVKSNNNTNETNTVDSELLYSCISELSSEKEKLLFSNKNLEDRIDVLRTNYEQTKHQHSNETALKDIKILVAEIKVDTLEKKCSSLIEELNEAMNALNLLSDQNNKLLMQLKKSGNVLNAAQKKAEYFESKMQQYIVDNDTTNYVNASAQVVVNGFFKNLHLISKQKNRNLNSMLENVAINLFTTKEFDGVFVEKLIAQSQRYYRANIFSPPNLLKLLDQNGGQLSMTGIELLRTLETKCTKYSYNSIFPPMTTIRRCAAVVDNIANQILPFKEGVLENGAEFCEFEVAPVVKLMLKGYQLEGVSKERSIVINQAIDGARLTNRLHHTTYGLKMADRGARDPMTGTLMYGSTNSSTIQSKHYCHPIKIILSHESNEIIEEFRGVIEQVKQLTIPEVSEKLLNGSKPISTYINADMSAQWKLIKRGRAVKRGEGMPCHICAIQDDHLDVQNAVRCNKWCEELHLDKQNWNCYHQPFLNDKAMNMLRHDLDEVKSEIKHILSKFEEIQKQTDLNIIEDPRKPISMQQINSNTSIHFNVQRDGIRPSKLQQYQDSIHHDLQLRNLSTEGSLLECQQRLKTQLVQEYNYKRLIAAISHVEGTDSDRSFILMADCPPCILHMEMRTVLKFLQIILDDGLKYIKDRNGTTKMIENYVQRIRKIFNEVILGKKQRPCTISVHYNRKDKVIDDITLDGKRCRKLLYNFKPLLDECIKNREKRGIWDNILKNYIVAFEILRSKEDLELDQIKQFQLHVDLFYQEYLGLYGKQGVTNYFHMLGAGHVAEYLIECGNLYIHSQQGWEAFNSFLKVFYFRRTSRGGGKGSESNRIRQIRRWLARRLIWNSGYSYKEITQHNVFGLTTDTEGARKTVYSENNEVLLEEHEQLLLDDDDTSLEWHVPGNDSNLPSIEENKSIDTDLRVPLSNNNMSYEECADSDEEKQSYVPEDEYSNIGNQSYVPKEHVTEEDDKLIFEYACKSYD